MYFVETSNECGNDRGFYFILRIEQQIQNLPNSQIENAEQFQSFVNPLAIEWVRFKMKITTFQFGFY